MADRPDQFDAPHTSQPRLFALPEGEPMSEEPLAEAREQIEALKRELDENPAAGTARRRAAREREERLRAALQQVEEIEAKKKESEKEKARASTTDPEARVMKMGDGGRSRGSNAAGVGLVAVGRSVLAASCRTAPGGCPACNVRFATDCETQIITGVDVVNSGGDQGKMRPMVEQHDERYGETPDDMLGNARRHAGRRRLRQEGRHHRRQPAHRR